MQLFMKSLLPLVLLFLLPWSALRATTQINTGGTFYFEFDTTSSSLPPPYDEFQPQMHFNSSDPFSTGDGFTTQLFDLSGNALSMATLVVWSQPFSITDLGFAFNLLAPSPAAKGYIQFSDVVGSFALADYQAVIGYKYGPPQTTSTYYVQANLEIGSFPGWSGPVSPPSASVPENMTILPWLGCALAGAAALRGRSRKLVQK